MKLFLLVMALPPSSLPLPSQRSSPGRMTKAPRISPTMPQRSRQNTGTRLPLGGNYTDIRATHPQGNTPEPRLTRTTPLPTTTQTSQPVPLDRQTVTITYPQVDALAMELMNPRSDRDKAYAAFNWVSENIHYDNATKWQRRYGNSGNDQSPAAVLAARQGVCEGIANLFTALANRMGLQSEVVFGKASGARQENHAWNAVMVDGKWCLVDITRHSFLPPPEEFLARHFPVDPRWQLIGKPLTYEEWLKR